MVLSLLKRWLGGAGAPGGAPAARAPLGGSVRVGEREWRVREERRAGPWPQLLVLTAADAEDSEMHVRLPEAQEARELEEVAAHAEQPTYRWFRHGDGRRWESRIVVPDPPAHPLVKFVCWPDGVHEGRYPFEDGLGRRSDEELRALLDGLRGPS